MSAAGGHAPASAAGGQTTVVSKPGKCEREVTVGKTTHRILHSWLPVDKRGIKLTTTLMANKQKGRIANKSTKFVENSEDALCSAAADMAHSILKNKRDWFLKTQQRKAGGSSSTSIRRNADIELADPVKTALQSGRRTRSGVETNRQDGQEKEIDWRKQSAETFLASMDSMGTDAALTFLESKGLEVAADILREVRDLKAKAEVGVAHERAIETAKKHNKSNEGRRTWQTLLTAAAFRRPVNDDQEAEEEEGEPASMSSKRKGLGVREGAWSHAGKRVKQLQADLHPREAIKKGVYWFWPRAQRSDATSEKLMELMRQYWHDDQVSRATGNSGDRDMWKESKCPTAHCHPRRQLTEPGGGDAVYAKFLKWANYRSFKSNQGDDFVDPGRTLFLSTRCKCLTLPVIEQCACKEITFPPRKAECTVSRVTGTQWQESDKTSARDLWENLRREEEPALVVNEGQFDDSL